MVRGGRRALPAGRHVVLPGAGWVAESARNGTAAARRPLGSHRRTLPFQNGGGVQVQVPAGQEEQPAEVPLDLGGGPVATSGHWREHF